MVWGLFLGIFLALLNKKSQLRRAEGRISKKHKGPERKGSIMSYYYLIKSMTKDGFGELRFVDNGEESRISPVKQSDIEAIERLLDVYSGTLSNNAYFLSRRHADVNAKKR